MDSLRKKAAEKGLFVFESEPARLSLAGAPKGYDGDLAAFLRDHRVECDYAAAEAAVLMPTPFNSDAEFELLERAVAAFEPEGEYRTERLEAPPQPVRMMTPREAVFSPAEELPVDEILGRVAAESKILCPPGVAVVVAGERVDEAGQKLLKKSGIPTLKVV